MPRQFVTFRVDGALFGVDVLVVREINQHLDISPVPRARDCVRGLINLRGQIITILDLGVRLGLAPRAISGESHVVILKTNAELANTQLGPRDGGFKTCDDLAGLLVDAVGDILDVDESDIAPAPANAGQINGQFITGVIRLEEELLILLNAEEVVSLSGHASKAA
jgi:purine-binding chemotaxis protein CheW